MAIATESRRLARSGGSAYTQASDYEGSCAKKHARKWFLCAREPAVMAETTGKQMAVSKLKIAADNPLMAVNEIEARKKLHEIASCRQYRRFVRT